MCGDAGAFICISLLAVMLNSFSFAICISSAVKYLFIFWPFSNWVIFFFHSWVLRLLYVLGFCWICALQIFSPTLWLVLSSFWQVFHRTPAGVSVSSSCIICGRDWAFDVELGFFTTVLLWSLTGRECDLEWRSRASLCDFKTELRSVGRLSEEGNFSSPSTIRMN